MDIFGNWAFLAILISSGLLALIFLAITIARKLLFICEPNKVMIFSGRKHKTADGRSTGFRVVHGGRAFRIPILERVDSMDMRLISVPMTVEGAYSEGGIPLKVHAIANVKISSNPTLIGNAIERFLGRERSEIGRVAKEMLEGHLRGVVAMMTPEEVNEDRLTFASRLLEEAEADLQKLGLQLDTLKIQHVSDDRNYLDSIGRKRIAEILREAAVAESDAKRSAEESEAEALARGRVAEDRAEAKILERRNELRRYVAELDATIRTEEEITEAAALTARAQAEQEHQRIRAQLEQLRLQADVQLPAEVERRVSELLARGQASSIEENGRAMAQALKLVAEAWMEAGDRAMDIFVLQNLEPLFARVAQAAEAVTVKRANLIDGGDGKAIPNYVAAYPATVRALLDEVSETLGVDIRGVIKGTTSNDGRKKLPPAVTRRNARTAA